MSLPLHPLTSEKGLYELKERFLLCIYRRFSVHCTNVTFKPRSTLHEGFRHEEYPRIDLSLPTSIVPLLYHELLSQIWPSLPMSLL